MNNWKKVIITLVIIIVLVILVWIIVKTSHEVGANNTLEENIVNNANYENVANEVGNEVDENAINDIETNVNQTTGTGNSNITSNQEQQPEGKEEAESNEENQGVNEEEQAIEMAKQAWGLNTDVYTFAIDSKQGDVYRVSIISNATVIAYYDVNVKTGEVTEN